MRLVTLALLIGLTPMPVLAQPAPAVVQQPRCWLGNMGYSPGSTVRAANAVMVCTDDFSWQPTADWAAGCLHAGTFYGIGAIPNASNQQQVISEC